MKLGKNKLTEIEDYTFLHLNQLIDLNLNENKLRALRKNTFVGLRNLRMLYIHNNYLESISEESFSSMAYLEYLELFGSNMKCSCLYIKTLKSLNTETLLADCRNVHGGYQIPTMLQPISYDFTPWVMLADCETGWCNPGLYMRTVMCWSCKQTNSPLCTHFTVQDCILMVYEKHFRKNVQGGMECHSLACGDCKKENEKSNEKNNSDGRNVMHMFQWISMLLVQVYNQQ